MMRLTPLVIAAALTVSCGLLSSDPAPDVTSADPITAQPGPAEPSEVPVASPFAAACEGTGPRESLERHTLADGPDIVLIQCEMFAYQGAYEVWSDDTNTQTPLLKVVGFPTFDDATQKLTNFQKYRGPGDCGLYQVWAATPGALTLLETRERDCTDEPPVDINPSTWPLVTDSGHCASETAYFNCSVSGGKVVSLCGAADGSKLQYRFGPIGSAELSFPADSSPGAFSLKVDRWIRGESTTLSFMNDGFTYAIVETMEGGGMDAPPPDEFVGVVVSKDGAEVARVPCTGEPTSSLQTLDLPESQPMTGSDER